MALVETASIQCPYCWEVIEVVVDCSVATQHYVEDCEICCRPISLSIEVGPDGLPSVLPQPEND